MDEITKVGKKAVMKSLYGAMQELTDHAIDTDVPNMGPIWLATQALLFINENKEAYTPEIVMPAAMAMKAARAETASQDKAPEVAPIVSQAELEILKQIMAKGKQS